MTQRTIFSFPRTLNKGERGTFTLGRRHLTSTNPWTRAIRINGPVDERWIANITRPATAVEEWSSFESFLMLVDGLGGLFTFFDPIRKFPRGSAARANGVNDPVTFEQWDDSTNWDDGAQWEDGASTASIAAAAVRGTTALKLSGLRASQAISMAAGDHLTIRLPGQSYGYLHQVVQDVPSDASGNATVNLRPRLRRNVTVGDIVDLEYASAVFRLADDDQGAVERFAPSLGRSSFELIEAFEALEL